jgi:hypothetical protein
LAKWTSRRHCREAHAASFSRRGTSQRDPQNVSPDFLVLAPAVALEGSRSKARKQKEAERRQAHPSMIRATLGACCHALALRAQRAPRRSARLKGQDREGALAWRRSTAATASGLSPVSLGFRPGFLGRGPAGRYPASPVPVQWQHPTRRS